MFLTVMTLLAGLLAAASPAGHSALAPRPYLVQSVSLPEIFPDMARLTRKQYKAAAKTARLERLLTLPAVRQAGAQADFILVFTLQEVPGWRHSGLRGRDPAQNIGFRNDTAGKPVYPAWPRLRGIPLLNSVDFLKPSNAQLRNSNSTLSAIHEMGHHWGVYWSDRPDCGPREWTPQEPLICLMNASSHWTWTWTWTPEKSLPMPGILYSGPTSAYFNAFDLYAMGLMPYEVASRYVYHVYSERQPKQIYPVTLKQLLAALSRRGQAYFDHGGKRIPPLDPDMARIRVLLLLLKDPKESISPEADQLLRKLAQDLPADWYQATWKRSRLEVVNR
ncbi:MAG: hypothetical protein ACAI44_38515 [Candidatus Sericytochromatia bacterium]